MRVIAINLKFYCNECEREYPINTLKYKCSCGGLFKLKGQNGKLYTDLFLGEGDTPILKRKIGGKEIYLKLDYMQPTGSFKDRGAAVMIDQLRRYNIEKILEDSSGNAGASIAAYAAAAGMECCIYLPFDTSQGKIKQIKAYGAEIVKVKGNREETSEAIKDAAKNYYYASHVYNPLFFAGTESLAYELEECPGIPDKIFIPVGNGTMFIGLYNGFKRIGKIPKLYAVQSEKCAPIFNYFNNKKFNCEKTQAEGIAVSSPERMEEIITGVKESNGDIITVSENEIKQMWVKLNEMGLYVEKTAAAAPAGYIKSLKEGEIDKNEKIVVPLTGIGLKK